MKNNLTSYALNFFEEYNTESVVEWAEENAFLSERISEQAGQYSTKAYPYVKEILENINDPDIRRISMCWGSQTSKTTTSYISVGYIIDKRPSPILWVWPTEANAKTFAQDRLIPFFEDTKAIRQHIPKTIDGKLDREKLTSSRVQFDRCSLNLVGGQSKANVRNFPVSFLVLDEIDIIPEPCRREALDRVKGRRDYKILQASTPLEETTGIWQEFKDGDQRKFMLKCPHCEERISLEWRRGKSEYNIRCDKEVSRVNGVWDYKKVLETSKYYCQKCDEPINDAQKSDMMQDGQWIAQSDSAIPDHRSYHLNSLYSPTLRFGEILTKWLQANDNVDGIKNFVQGWLAEPWRDEILNVAPEQVLELQDDYDRGEKKGTLRILSADVQRSHFWWTCRGFNESGESWLIDHGMCPSFDDLDSVFETYDCRYGIVDTGYGDRTQEIYEQIWRRRGSWWGIKGWKTMTLPYKHNAIDPFSGTAKQGTCKIPLVHVNVTIWQGELSQRRAGKIKDWHIYREPDPNYLKQMTSKWQHEQVDKKGNVKIEWRTKSHQDDHYWDCETYTLAFVRLVGYGNIPRGEINRRANDKASRRNDNPHQGRKGYDGFWSPHR